MTEGNKAYTNGDSTERSDITIIPENYYKVVLNNDYTKNMSASVFNPG